MFDLLVFIKNTQIFLENQENNIQNQIEWQVMQDPIISIQVFKNPFRSVISIRKMYCLSTKHCSQSKKSPIFLLPMQPSPSDYNFARVKFSFKAATVKPSKGLALIK